jgi:hypothetical protein
MGDTSTISNPNTAFRKAKQMAKARVLVIHDEFGRIVSMTRPAKDAKVIILSGDGHSVFETEVDEERLGELVAGGHRADPEQKSVVKITPRQSRSSS